MSTPIQRLKATAGAETAMGRDPFDSKLNEMEKALNLLVKHANDASFRSYADDNGSGNATDALNDLRKKINDAKKAFDDFCDEMM